jgi:hypothetical protein
MNSRIQVSRWLKSLMYVVSAVPGLASLAVFVPNESWPGRNVWLNVFGVFLLLGASIWLFRRIYFLCSIVLTQDGLEQSVPIPRAGTSRQIQLGWDEIVKVSFSGLSFHFLGRDGEKLELNTALFNDSTEIIRTVRDRLPARLRAQPAY